MVIAKGKRKNRQILSRAQSVLLRESLKDLLGPGLIDPKRFKDERKDRVHFLKEAINARFLDAEFLS
jgi:hypothetical protein